MTGPDRVVVTGLGALAPNGSGVERYWAATLAGQSGIGPIRRFDPERYPVRLAGEITDLDPAAELPGRLVPQTDRVTQLALVATEQALRDAALGDGDGGYGDLEVGVVTSAAGGGFEYGQRELQKLWTEGPGTVSTYMSFSWFYAVNTGQISIRHGLRGPAAAVVTDSAGGLDAIGQARRLIRRGTPAVIMSGLDSAMCPMGLACQLPDGRLSTRTDPAVAYRPFDVDANGHLPGEGGATLVLESEAAARRRGRPVYGEIAGYAATFDPAPGRDREPGLGRAAALALERADLLPDDIDVVFADGAGLPDADQAESQALAKIFGPRGVPVTVPRSMTGRLGAGSGALDVVAALLAVRDRVIPPTVHVTRVAPGCEIDLVTRARPAPVRAGLVLARGTGGFNTAVVVRAA